MSSPVLPAPYEQWMNELVGPIEPEHRSTCHDCAMAPSPQNGPPQQVFYRPDLKCCTFHPNLPNFRVGAILRDPDSPGRVHLEKRIVGSPGVTPMFVARPPVYDVVYRKAPSESTFGAIPKLRCPFLTEDGGCGIWKHREATCTTWFCRFNRGSVGRNFWGALRRLLVAIEKEVSTWCLLELDIGDHALAAMTSDASQGLDISDVMDRIWDEHAMAQHVRRWGNWAGREREFYIACSERAETLTWSQVLAIGGARLAAQARAVTVAHRALSDTSLPPALTTTNHRSARTDHGTARVIGYSELDPIEVDVATITELHRFDGRPTDEALAASGIDRDTARRLVDHGVLVPLGVRPLGRGRME